MSHKKSFSTLEKNKNIWAKNLMNFQQSHKRRGAVLSQKFSLEEKYRIPLKKQIVERYQFLFWTKGKNSEHFQRSSKFMEE